MNSRKERRAVHGVGLVAAPPVRMFTPVPSPAQPQPVVPVAAPLPMVQPEIPRDPRMPQPSLAPRPSMQVSRRDLSW